MGTQLPKRDTTLQFAARVSCGQMAGWINMKLGMEVGLDPGNIVLDGDPAPNPKKDTAPKYSARVYRGQTAGRIRIPLGTEAGLGLGHIVLDWDPALQRGTTAPIFGPMSIVAKRSLICSYC